MKLIINLTNSVGLKEVQTITLYEALCGLRDTIASAVSNKISCMYLNTMKVEFMFMHQEDRLSFLDDMDVIKVSSDMQSGIC